MQPGINNNPEETNDMLIIHKEISTWFFSTESSVTWNLFLLWCEVIFSSPRLDFNSGPF